LIFSEEVNEMVYKSILDKVKSYKKVGVLGISFKPNSPVTIGSPSARLIKDLLELEIEVNGYDSISESYTNLDLSINTFSGPQDCIDNSDVVVIMHPDKQYSELNYYDKGIIDYWGIMK
jgi:UDPglucose 6-dehydrogenase